MFVRPMFGKTDGEEKKNVKTERLYPADLDDEGIPRTQYLPRVPSEWKRDPSAKIDYLLDIVQHHLSQDNNRPIYAIRRGKPVIAAEHELPLEARAPRPTGLPSDKILIYSAFPLNNDLIIRVLGLHGWSAAQINGSMSAKARSDALRKFKQSTSSRGPRILIVSNVGTVGLNIPEANILIQMASPWNSFRSIIR